MSTGKIEVAGEHGPSCFSTCFTDTNNAADETLDLTDQMSMEHQSWPAKQVCKAVKDILDDECETWHGVADKKILQRARDNRKNRDAEQEKLIEQEHVGKMKESNQWFVNANLTIADRQNHKLKQFSARGNPELMCLLKGKVRLRIDAAFEVCPKKHEQMLVIIACDMQLDACVDVLRILVSGEL